MTDSQPPSQPGQPGQAPGPVQHPNPGGDRPVERIDDTLEALRDYWHAHPDLRLGQIITNIAEGVGRATPGSVFVVEDAWLAARLREETPQVEDRDASADR